MMKVYLSARLARREELQGYARDLVRHRMDCTARWLEGEPQELSAIALMDEEDVRRADAVVTFTDPPSDVVGILRASKSVHPGLPPYGVSVEPGSVSEHPWAARGGRHVEFGMARAWGKICIVVGPRENVFHHLPGVHQFETWAEALEYLGGL